MPIVGFDEKDFLRGKIVAPAWYRMKITDVSEKLSANGESTNYPVEGEIIRNATDGSTDYTGVPVIWNFNSKAKGFMIGFFQSLGVDVKPNVRLEMSAAVGHEIDVYVENKTYEGRVLNAVNHKYRRAE